MSMLEELYNGEIYPLEQIVPDNKDYRQTKKRSAELREYFRALLTTEENRQKFEEWNSLDSTAYDMECYANFSYGFRMGVRLVFEALSKDCQEEE